jgi:hypothetical protein
MKKMPLGDFQRQAVSNLYPARKNLFTYITYVYYLCCFLEFVRRLFSHYLLKWDLIYTKSKKAKT